MSNYTKLAELESAYKDMEAAYYLHKKLAELESAYKDMEAAYYLLSKHHTALLLENADLQKRLMRNSLWYSIKRAIRIWRGKEWT